MLFCSKVNRKLFGHCKVEWWIEHFRLQTFKEEWMIQSQNFIVYGFEETSWYMFLRSDLINKSRSVLFTLKRSDTDPGPEYIRLELKMYCECFKARPFHYEDNLCFKKGAKYEICLGTYKEIDLENLFVIVCDVIVHNNSTSRKHSKCDIALKLLSENMLDLYRSSRYFDTKLIFGHNVIFAHRAILYARNKYLSSMIENYEDSDDSEEYMILDFTESLNYKGMGKILAYLYTGDSRHIFEEPSFAIYDCAVFLGIKEIEIYYKPDKLILKSTIDFLEYSCILREYNFDGSQLSFRINSKGPIINLQVVFYPTNHNKDCISLLTETYGKQMNGFIDVTFIDKSGHLFTIPIKDEFIDIEGKEKMEYVQSINNNAFEVVIKLKLTANMKILSIDEKRVFINCRDEYFYYKRLSNDLRNLFMETWFTDTEISINGFIFSVHKCILISRSQFFWNMLEINEEREVILVPNVGIEILRKLLIYVYSGALTVFIGGDNIIDLYEVAFYTNLPHLKLMCSKRLNKHFTYDITRRCRAINVANEYNDDALLKSVLIHLFKRKNFFSHANDLIRIEGVHICRHCR